MPWLDVPQMMDMPEDEGIGENTGIMAGALKQRLMGRPNPTAPNPKLPPPDINVAEPPMPAPSIPGITPKLDTGTGSKFAGGMKSL